MKFYFTLLLAASLLVSCQRVQKIVTDAKAEVEKSLLDSSETIETATTDRALEALVDKTDQGYLFRKDLPFPADLDVQVIRQVVYSNAREIETSLAGREASRLNGTFSEDFTVSRRGDSFVLTFGKQSQWIENPSDPTQSIEQNIPQGKSGKSIHLNFLNSQWSSRKTGDFTTLSWAQKIAPAATPLFIESGALPRTFWFGKKRLKIGDSVSLSKAELPLLVAFPASGNLELKFISTAPVHGHPCGVFEITGNYAAKNVIDELGESADLDVTISSGKVWLSLLYPLVLKQEFETVKSIKTRSSQLQGGLKISIERNWKPASGH